MNGLYIHVPFCIKKCLYCDFYSVMDMALIDGYVAALVREMDLTSAEQGPELKSVDTIYFGGGTPSVLSPRHLDTIFAKIHTLYRVVPHAEITLEVNPGTAAPGILDDFRSLGINRLSIGVQSFQDRHLTFLGRIHSSDDSRALIRLAEKAGFDDVGLDLIYGLPGQDINNWRMDLETALSFQPAHLSCYMLTWEHGTPLFKQMERGHIVPLDDDSSGRLFEETMAFLGLKGFVHYEISNYAQSREKRSRHNQKYWEFEPYTGFGPSAHSFQPSENRRYWNVRDLSLYVHELNQDRLPVEESETLDRSQQMTEALFLGFRKTEGIHLSDFNTRFHCDFEQIFREPLAHMIRDGLVIHDRDRVYLSRNGLVLADRVTSCFVDYGD